MSYSPTLGRWIEQDPYSYVNGANTYQLEKANPLNGLDPMGTATISHVEMSNPYGSWNVFYGPESKTQPGGNAGGGATIIFSPGNTCPCKDIAFVQLQRVTNLQTGKIIPQHPGRQDANGWAVDRGPFKNGWYGYEDDGTPGPSAQSSNPNSNDVTMSDRPHSPGVNRIYQFRAYAVCKDGGENHGKVFGGVAWDISVDPNGNAYMPEPWMTGPDLGTLNGAGGLWNDENVPADEPPHEPLPVFF